MLLFVVNDNKDGNNDNDNDICITRLHCAKNDNIEKAIHMRMSQHTYEWILCRHTHQHFARTNLMTYMAQTTYMKLILVPLKVSNVETGLIVHHLSATNYQWQPPHVQANRKTTAIGVKNCI